MFAPVFRPRRHPGSAGPRGKTRGASGTPLSPGALATRERGLADRRRQALVRKLASIRKTAPAVNQACIFRPRKIVNPFLSFGEGTRVIAIGCSKCLFLQFIKRKRSERKQHPFHQAWEWTIGGVIEMVAFQHHTHFHWKDVLHDFILLHPLERTPCQLPDPAQTQGNPFWLFDHVGSPGITRQEQLDKRETH